jgi:hypothetical protein
VLAKPAPQTPLIAARAVDLMLRAGVPATALQLLPGGAMWGRADLGPAHGGRGLHRVHRHGTSHPPRWPRTCTPARR